MISRCPECWFELEEAQPHCGVCGATILWDRSRPVFVGYDLSGFVCNPGPRHPVYHFVGDMAGVVRLKVGFFSKRCQYACRFCGIPRSSSRTEVRASDVIAQLSLALDTHRAHLPRVQLLALDNSGSILDCRTFSEEALAGALRLAKDALPGVRVQLESRPEFISSSYLAHLRRLVGAPLDMQIGLETLNDAIRSGVLGKAMSLAAFEAAFGRVADSGGDLSVFILVKPGVQMSEEDALLDAIETCAYLVNLAQAFGTNLLIRPCAMNAVPGTPWGDEAMSRGWTPPSLLTMARVARFVIESGARCYLGLSEEGQTPLQNTYWRYPESTNLIHSMLHEVNHTQSLSSLDEIIARYGKSIDNRPAEEKFRTFAQPLPRTGLQ